MVRIFLVGKNCSKEQCIKVVESGIQVDKKDKRRLIDWQNSKELGDERL